MLRGLEGWHFVIVAVVFVLLFGAKKLPDSAKSIAKSLKIFKSEMKDGNDKDNKDDKGDATKSDS
jgi:sec-independent protein translocase protein TatA